MVGPTMIAGHLSSNLHMRGIQTSQDIQPAATIDRDTELESARVGIFTLSPEFLVDAATMPLWRRLSRPGDEMTCLLQRSHDADTEAVI